jgi:hypothetical protein
MAACFPYAGGQAAFFITAVLSFAKTYSAGKFYFKANINILLSFLQLKGGRFYGI